MVLDCFSILNDVELTKKEKVLACLIIFYNLDDFDDLEKLPDLQEATDKMYDFFNCGQKEQPKNKHRLIDWDKDSMIICSAVNNVAGKEVRGESYLHWWTFMGYYMAIGDCALSTIVNIRYKIANNQKLEKHERKFRTENPQYFNMDYRSMEEIEEDNYIRDLWNS